MVPSVRSNAESGWCGFGPGSSAELGVGLASQEYVIEPGAQGDGDVEPGRYAGEELFGDIADFDVRFLRMPHEDVECAIGGDAGSSQRGSDRTALSQRRFGVASGSGTE